MLPARVLCVKDEGECLSWGGETCTHLIARLRIR